MDWAIFLRWSVYLVVAFFAVHWLLSLMIATLRQERQSSPQPPKNPNPKNNSPVS